MLAREAIHSTIGKGFADNLDEPIFSFGGTEISKRTMIEEFGCANFQAASRLAKVLKRLDVTTIAKLHKTSPFDIARVKGIGEAAIYVAMCMLDAGKYDVQTWWGWKDSNNVKFSSFKHHAIRKAKKNGHAV